MFNSPPAQPQSAADLIGRAFRLYRGNITFVVKTLLGPTIVAAVGALAIQITLNYGLLNLAEKPVMAAVWAVIFIAGFLVLVLSKWVLTIRQLALVRMASGFADDYKQADEYVYKRKWVLAGLFCVYVAAVIMVAVACVVFTGMFASLSSGPPIMKVVTAGGIVLGIAGLFILVGLVVCIGFIVLSVLACEDTSFGNLISRGINLATADIFRLIWFGALLLITISLISYPLSIPVVLVTCLDFAQQGLWSDLSSSSGYNPSVFVMVTNHVWEGLVNMVIWPAVFFAFGFLYYDFRLRQEGLDITRNLDSQEEPAR